MNQFGYRPDGLSLWDTWYLVHEGVAHMFYLQRYLPGTNRPESDFGAGASWNSEGQGTGEDSRQAED